MRHVVESIERRLLLSASLPPANPFKPTPPISVASDVTLSATPGSTTPSGYSPNQVRSAYGVNLVQIQTGVFATGAGETIAIVDAYDDPTATADLQAFDTHYGLAAPPSFIKVNDAGSTANLPGTDPDGPYSTTGDLTWETEESLDIEYAHAMAPAANIVLVEANDPSDLYNAANAAAHYANVDVVSMSWGESEFSGETSYDSIFTTPAGHNGVSFVASAGDTGAFDQDGTTITAAYPAASPNVIAVGGTSLTISGGSYAGETAWGNGANSGVLGGGGGGISAFEAQPAYQAAAAAPFSTTMRTYPDVSLIADPNTGVAVYDSYDFGTTTPWAPFKIGGTSLAAPSFAGMLSLTDQIRAANGLASLDGPTQTLPDIYNLRSNGFFHDITSGNNGFPAGVGYDLATGIGSPIAYDVFPALANDGISGEVFNDANADGVLDAGDGGGVSGVTVQLYSVGPDGVVGTADDVLQNSTVTNTTGLYQLNDPNSTAISFYYIHFVLPAGFTFSPQVGTAAGDSLPNPATGNTAEFTASATAREMNFDAGIYQRAVNITSVSHDEGNSGLTPYVFTITVSPIPSTAVIIPYTTADGTATVADNDYVPQTGTITVPAGQTQATITVDVVGDTKPELNETFTVNLTRPAGYVNGTVIGVGTIINDDFPTATVSSYTATRLDARSQDFPFVVTLNEAAPFAVSIPYFTVDNTAISSIDYQSASGTLVIPAGSLTGTVDVVVYGGVNPQDNKTFLFSITASPTVLAGAPAQGTGTILTNFPPGISVADSTLDEPLTSATAMMPFVVSVEPSQTVPTVITYATADGTAVAGTDYTAVAGTLTFAPGQVQQTVFVPIYRRFTAAGSLTLTLNIAAPGSTLPLYRTAATGTIVDPGTVALPFSGRTRASYTDLLNNPVSVSLRGPGTGEVVFLGSTASATNAYEVLLDGTTGASTLVLSTRGGTQTPFQNIVTTSPLGAISGRGANLLSTLIVGGSLNSLNLGFVQGATLDIGAGAGALSINLGRAIDTTINSAIPIASLTAQAYLSTNGTPAVITAPSVGPIRVKEAFGGTVIHAASVAAITAGSMSDVSILAQQSIGTVTADTITGSTFFAGVEDGLDALPTTAAQFTSHTSRIGAVKVKAKQSGAFSDTRIAGWTVGAVKLGSVSTADGGTPFGVTGSTIASVTTTSTDPVHLVGVSDTTPSLVDDDFTVDAV